VPVVFTIAKVLVGKARESQAARAASTTTAQNNGKSSPRPLAQLPRLSGQDALFSIA